MNTYPNQKIIHINKKSYKSNFLQVGIEEWQEAFQQLKPSTFAVYLYLASNADGFDLALSQKAVEKALNIKKTAYHSAIAELKEKGYIGTMQGNIDYFFTSPVRKCGLTEDSANADRGVRKNGQECPQTRIEESAKTDSGVRKNDREIDKINNINKINNIDNAAFSSEVENPNSANIENQETRKNQKNPKNPNIAVVENPKNPKNLNDNVNVNVNNNDNVNDNVNEKEKDIFAFSWLDEEEEEERKKKVVESAKQVRLAAIRKNSDSRFRDEEEQEYFDFTKGANIEKGMSETAAEADAWQMILDEREYNVSKIS